MEAMKEMPDKAIACHIHGYDLDLYEIDKEYFETGRARVEKFMSQGVLPL
ncbi:MAG: hypothetical protein KBH82_12515 [Syntrophorhabdaceae bacterium]|nr:hypothetical protein [Syntrophorhabdaceae bacterium]